jgi:hypothetical protein
MIPPFVLQPAGGIQPPTPQPASQYRPWNLTRLNLFQVSFRLTFELSPGGHPLGLLFSLLDNSNVHKRILG